MASANIHELPVANRDAMRDFLAEVVREHIHLVAIFPDGDAAPPGKWFGEDADGAANWASIQNANGRNIYWTVNRTRRGLNKKPGKTDIISARFAHADVDPPKDGSPWDRDAMIEDLQSFDPPPSFIINSGGGFGVFWRLEYEAENWGTVELINQSLEDRFGGDHCWNIDRLMRVPGTLNYPNAVKRARGRGLSIASVALADDGGEVDPEHLRVVLPAPTPRKDSKRERVALEGVVTATPAELGITTLNRLLSMIEQPTSPDRSDDTWAVACEMVRQGFDDKQIAGILLNPDLAISASPLDKTSPLREVGRAISGARADVGADPGNARPFDFQRQHFAAIDSDGSADNDPANDGDAAPPLVSATPYVFRLPETIAPREWVYGRSIQRGHLRAVVAQGGAGKTILSVAEALAMVTGRNLLGQSVPAPMRVWLWNLEDDREELSRIIQAACKHWQIGEADIGGRLFVDSALDGAVLKLARSTPSGGLIINRPLVDALTEEMKARQIDYLHVDPFVSSHSANENDNMEVDAIAKEWAMVAKNADAGIGLAHHISKAGAAEATALSARGAVALINACRSVMVLNRMNEDEAKRYLIEEERRRRFFRVYDDKNNRAPPSDASDWFEMLSINLGNGPLGDDGDSIGVVVPWSPPDALEGVEADTLYRVQVMVSEGRWRESNQSSQWVGRAVADVMGLSVASDAKADRARIGRLLRMWIENGALVTVDGKDEKRNTRTFIEVGHWAEPTRATPAKSEVGQSVAGEAPTVPRPTSPPIGGGGVASGASGNFQGGAKSGGAAAYVKGNPTLGVERGRTIF